MAARRRKRDPVSLGSVFGEFLEKRGLSKRYLYDRALLVWEEVAGIEIAPSTRPLKVENGNLVVVVRNSVMRQEVYFLKSSLIAAMNKKLGSTVIKDIILR